MQRPVTATAPHPPPRGWTKRARHTAWSGEQLGRILDSVADSPYAPAWLFLATSGSRRGEALGLQWDDLDLDAGTATMSRKVTIVAHRTVVKELSKTKAGGHNPARRRHRRDAREPPGAAGSDPRDDGTVVAAHPRSPYLSGPITRRRHAHAESVTH